MILDACRWDTLSDVALWPIDAGYSLTSATSQWLGVAEETHVFEDIYILSANAKHDTVDPRESELPSPKATPSSNTTGTAISVGQLRSTRHKRSNDSAVATRALAVKACKHSI